jgi:RNA polymerase sigma-70 factor (ECF subfamily)
MNATQLSLAGSLMLDAADSTAAADRATGPRAMSPLRALLDEVWQAIEGRLTRVALGIGLPSDQAADVLQDVYVMAMRKPPAVAEADELVKWLFRVTVNRCHLEHRRRGRWQRLWTSLARAWTGEAGSGAHIASGAAASGELKHEVDRALARLADDDRALVVMRYFAELNSRQIGEIVGLPEATVRGRLRAARRRLAVELADWDDTR